MMNNKIDVRQSKSVRARDVAPVHQIGRPRKRKRVGGGGGRESEKAGARGAAHGAEKVATGLGDTTVAEHKIS